MFTEGPKVCSRSTNLPYVILSKSSSSSSKHFLPATIFIMILKSSMEKKDFTSTFQTPSRLRLYKCLIMNLTSSARISEDIWRRFAEKISRAMNLQREFPSHAILQALRDETMNDARDCVAIAQTHVFYRPSLLGQHSSLDHEFMIHE
ncbi:hypothetical protein LWI28_026534 [Acer negundo]|uniref:Uncharacterized protein n=1 Tax=Acer negundo TaxID=4023 RepID=A0AAD5NMH6_ACENE|nr:hypothetical protein LWI28_026534 [Acer negundo]